jgi:AmmeMemoRadiSam system protein A
MDHHSTDPGGTLLLIARAAIATALGRSDVTPQNVAWLHEPGASFVTLTQQGALRGCIGSLQPRRSLLVDVKANAVAAALNDPRFAPLTLAELDCIHIDVAVLSVLQPLSFETEAHALAQLQPGVDGVMLEFEHYRSTFLPQVWEQLPSPSDFLTHLKRKAGLPPHFWAEGMRLSRYRVSRWSENEEPSDAHRSP